MINIQLVTQGELSLAAPQPTLADLEAFCKAARDLGLQDNARLLVSRQGMLGPIFGLRFAIPAVPKGPQA